MATCPQPQGFSFTTGIVPNVPPESADICAFYQLVSNVLGFLFYLAIPIATIMVVYGGFTLLTATGNEVKVKKGKAIITSALIGAAIVFGANIIIGSIFVAFGISSSALPW
jgi:hypothetical protein